MSSTQHAPPARQNSLDDAIPDEPPPAYTSVAGPQGDMHVQAGPSRVDFSGPPPMPARLNVPSTANVGGGGSGWGGGTPGHLEQNITGVGVGYGRRPSPSPNDYDSDGPMPGGFVGNGGLGGGQLDPGGFTSQTTGFTAPGGPGTDPFGDGYQAPTPPKHPSTVRPSPGRPNSSISVDQSQGRQEDLSPTEVPTPGRPLLHKGKLLVYPKGHFCSTCYNTGYKNNDPSHPHDTCWRKYGKPYNSALAHSYTVNITNPRANPSTSSSSNFQRPLPSHTPAGPSSSAYPAYHAAPSSPAPQSLPGGSNPYGHLPPPPGKWHEFPGQSAPPPPQQHGGYPGGYGPHAGAPPPGLFVNPSNSGYPSMAPPGALVVGPGDPRIGGSLCFRCGGDGRETSWFGFDDGRCWECGGLGRVFR